jgi:transcriptional regulator with XRE-family HTH domain
MELEKFGNFVALLRSKKNMTQKQLAEILNISDKAVSRWERGECYPEITQLPHIASVFGVTIDELLSCDIASIKTKPQSKWQDDKLHWKVFNFCCAVSCMVAVAIYLIYNLATNNWANWVLAIQFWSAYVIIVAFCLCAFGLKYMIVKPKRKTRK